MSLFIHIFVLRVIGDLAIALRKITKSEQCRGGAVWRREETISYQTPLENS